MKVEIDTSTGEISVDGVVVYREPRGKTIADYMEMCEGAKEWDATVQAIQRWYYGEMVKDAWCCTGLSFFADKAGVSDRVPKTENVDVLKDIMNSKGMLDCTERHGGGSYKPKRGDIVFMSLKRQYADCTHVGVISSINLETGNVEVISCNCNDAIMRKVYNYKDNGYIVAWGRVDY